MHLEFELELEFELIQGVLPVRNRNSRAELGPVGHKKVHCDSGPRAWGLESVRVCVFHSQC